MKMKKYLIIGCSQYNQGNYGKIKAKNKRNAERRLGAKFMFNHILKEMK